MEEKTTRIWFFFIGQILSQLYARHKERNEYSWFDQKFEVDGKNIVWEEEQEKKLRSTNRVTGCVIRSYVSVSVSNDNENIFSHFFHIQEINVSDKQNRKKFLNLFWMSFWSILLLLLETEYSFRERGSVVGKNQGNDVFFTFKNILLLFYFTKK